MSLASPPVPAVSRVLKGTGLTGADVHCFFQKLLIFFFRAFHAPVRNFKKHYIPNVSLEFLITIKSHTCVTGGRTKLSSFGFVYFFLKTVFYPKNCIGPSV